MDSERFGTANSMPLPHVGSLGGCHLPATYASGVGPASPTSLPRQEAVVAAACPWPTPVWASQLWPQCSQGRSGQGGSGPVPSPECFGLDLENCKYYEHH